ncbi:MAG: hypothetical protein JO023_28845 [Chloroflexi bacterium]|nr:hypothetical protein [Chloroflexota bacterium]
MAGVQPARTVTTLATTSLRTILADGPGATSYTYPPDTPGTSTCYGATADDWPPVVVAGIGQAPANRVPYLGLTIRPDGRQQLTYQACRCADSHPTGRLAT